MKTAAVLISAIVAQAAGDVCLSRGMKSIATLDAKASGLWGSLETVAHLAVQTMQNPLVLVGTLLLIIFFTLFSAALSWADLSFVLPTTSFGYVLNVAAGYYFLGENVSVMRWAGAAVITLGVVFVSKSGDRTVEPAADKVFAAKGPQ